MDNDRAVTIAIRRPGPSINRKGTDMNSAVLKAADAQPARSPAEDVANWTTVITDLRQRRDNAARRRVELAEQRKGHALAAMTGDAEARASLTKNSEALRQVEFEIGDLETAITEAEVRLGDAETAVQAAELARRRAEVSKLATQRVEAAEEIDRLIDRLDKAFADFEAAGRNIAGFRDLHSIDNLKLFAGYPIRNAITVGAPALALRAEIMRQPDTGKKLGETERRMWAGFI
jgi:hypothetical protein